MARRRSRLQLRRYRYRSSPKETNYSVGARQERLLPYCETNLQQHLSSILRRNGEVCTSLAYKAIDQQDFDAATEYAERAKAAYAKRADHVSSWQNLHGQAHAARWGCGRRLDSRPSLMASIKKYVRKALRASEIEKDVQTEQEARVALVNILSMEDRKKEAYDESDRAVQLNPSNVLALRARAQCLLQSLQLRKSE